MTIADRFLKVKHAHTDINSMMRLMLDLNRQIGTEPMFIELITDLTTAMTAMAEEIGIQYDELDQEMKAKYAP